MAVCVGCADGAPSSDTSTMDTSRADATIVDTASAIDASEDAIAIIDTSEREDTATAPIDAETRDELVDAQGEADDASDVVDIEPDATEVDATEVDATEVDDADATATSWRSALYPEDWTPSLTHPSGAFLHDFSWAGYHHGERELGDGLGEGGLDALPRFEVTSYGATPVALDAPGDATDATASFQAAIDAASAAGGGHVIVPAGLYRIDGRLVVQASRVVIGGEGADVSRVWLTKVAGMDYAAHIRFAGASQVIASSALVVDADARSHVVQVADASSFTVGDDVQLGQVVTDAFIAEHGMTGTWQAFNGTWQPFFHRTVTAVDAEAGTVTLDVPLRYPMKVAHAASLKRVAGSLREVGLHDLGVANAIGWVAAWATNQVHAIAFEHVADAWVRGVATFPSPGAPTEGLGAGLHLISSGILVAMSKRVTIADTHLAKSEHRGSGGNGYLFEIRQSSEVLTRDSTGTAGRHNFIQNWGFGATGNVWLRVTSTGGENVISPELGWAVPAASEYHHSLATANLFDASVTDDGFKAVNRGTESTGAGHSATACVFWNIAGSGFLTSRQFGLGYVVGTAPGLSVGTKVETLDGIGTAPEDWREGVGEAAGLSPQSLYEDQLARRLGRR